MACAELVEVITEYLEGTLGDQDRRRFEAHLAVCPYCLDYLDQMREVIDAMGTLEVETLSPRRQEELLAAFRGWRES
jgi:anti-sigma factor RsiW